MCISYQDVLEKDLGLFNKKTINEIKEKSQSVLPSNRDLLDIVNIQIREKQREQLEEIHQLLLESDLVVNNRKVSFEELLSE